MASDGTHLYAMLATNLLASHRRAQRLPNRQIDMSIEIEHRDAMLTNNKFTWLDDHVAEQRTEAHVEVASFCCCGNQLRVRHWTKSKVSISETLRSDMVCH